MNTANTHIVWTPGTTLEQIERRDIELAYSFYRGNKAAVSRALGISVRTIETKLKRFERDDADELKAEHDRGEERKRLLALQRGETYQPTPYIEPEERPTDPADGDDTVLEKTELKTRKDLPDVPPVIPPPASSLSAKVVGAR